MENAPLGPKTTMRIGGSARYFAELKTQKDIEGVVVFAEEKGLPLVMLGGGSNTIFADGTIEAVVCKIAADRVSFDYAQDDTIITVETGKILASLLNELAEQNLDLSPLTGIPGTVGGAIFGNAGQGFDGTWIGAFVKDVTFYHEKQWRTWTGEECGFGYRESVFKKITTACHPEPVEGRHARAMVRRACLPVGEAHHDTPVPPIIWSITLSLPTSPTEEIQAEIEKLLQKRIETQPHLKTAGSCFKSLSNGIPAWKLIDAAGLRGFRVGDVQVAEKHANFLLNVGKASFAEATTLVQKIRSCMDQSLDVEMRFVGRNGSVIF